MSPYLFDLVMDVVTRGIRDQLPWCMLFADDMVLCSNRREVVEEKLGKWRREMEDKRTENQQEKDRVLEVER